ncbi:hypothetical protein JD844_006579 [Phrynosoma platyrhinos]|uniref:Uncharacterized protein n=1 Tax=Phrynosoma platyrhinos TaxID=52577 RepID=A0ABQ7T2B6_PHRPL|nr:hypothetical protein JD844_006579 [Phrynosoma platyrhinos]
MASHHLLTSGVTTHKPVPPSVSKPLPVSLIISSPVLLHQSRPAKRLRVNDDGHSDIPEQIQLKEFDFINKGPGQWRKPYYDQHPVPLEETRQSHFVDHQFSNDYQKEMPLKDLDFARGSVQRLQPCHDHHLCDDFPGSGQPKDINMGHGQRQRHFLDIPPHSDMLIDSQVNRSHGQRQGPFYDPQSNDEYQSQMQFKKLCLHNKRPEHNDLQKEMPVKDFDNRDSESRCRIFHDSQSYDFSKQVQLKDFLNTKQRMRLFGESSLRDNIQYEGYVERDYGSDEEDYHRNCRSDCSEDCKKIGSSDEIIRGEKIRLAPYSSSPVYLSSYSHQEVSSIAVDCEREPQHEVTREMDQGKRLPVLIFDYNYGLPLNYIVEEDIAY